MACPKDVCFHILHLLMQYLYHHPHYPIFYSRKSSSSIHLGASCKQGSAEYFHFNKNTSLRGHVDADQSRDLLDRRSLVSALWTIDKNLVAWICKKQSETALHSNHAEMLSLLAAVKKTIEIRRILLQLGHGQTEPTIINEDNQPLITEVTHGRITPNVRHLDVPLAFLHEQYLRKIYDLYYIPTNLHSADVNTKPHGGGSLKKIILDLIGYSSFPPASSEHYKLLQLDKYVIVPDRISQRPKKI